MRDDKIMRTVRCRNDREPGTLGRLLLAIAEAGGDPGEIRLIQESHLAVVRDVTIYTSDEAQLGAVLAAMAGDAPAVCNTAATRSVASARLSFMPGPAAVGRR